MRWLVYAWASPTSLLGLFCIAIARPQVALVSGVLEAHGPGLAALLDVLSPRRPIAAMTLGHVVIARDAGTLENTRAHERVHVRQCEHWGPAFVPAYLAASAVAWGRGRDPYLDNAFEKKAWQEAPLSDARVG